MHRPRGIGRTEVVALIAVAGLGAALAAPALHGAQASARANVCAMNLATLVRAFTVHARDIGHYTPSYTYDSLNPANGYYHWSRVLGDGGYVQGDQVFQCPDVPRGGAPNTNPGPNAADWEAGQVNDIGATAPAAVPSDRQVKRLAYTANAAIMHRSKVAGVTPRYNQNVPGPQPRSGPGQVGAGAPQSPGSVSAVVRTDVVTNPGGTILLTEFLTAPAGSWRSIAQDLGGGWRFKSHRPVTPFLGRSTGTDVFNEPNGSGTIPRFRYPIASEILPDAALGAGMFDIAPTELNAVGRHHAGGTAFFAYTDAHVENSTVLQTVNDRRWGDRFLSITGNNAVWMD